MDRSPELCDMTATELRDLLSDRRVSATEVLESHLLRIEAVNPLLNAIVTLDADGAHVTAKRLDAIRDRSGQGPLHGLPIAVKDLEDTAGLRTTYGSPLFADHVPTHDTVMVSRMRAAGAVIVGKTNTPEFGAGSQTFNTVFGATRNPYDPDRTPGGSSGGAGAAVAAGMLPFADGSDLGASVRNPAAFCNLVGLRPTAGRIPDVPAPRPWDPLSVHGPLARTVTDAALLLGALAGPHPGAPLSGSLPAVDFTDLDLDPAGLRIAWSQNLSDLPVAAEVTATLAAARTALASLGCLVQDVEPLLAEADEAFEVLRGLGFVQAFGPLLDEHAGQLKDTIIENTRYGLGLTAVQIARGLAAQAATFETMRRLLEYYDALALPTAPVLPFPVQEPWVRDIEGTPMGSYLEWMRSCSRISATAHPAISVPGGFSAGGLPVGLQLVGRHGGERELLALARAFESATGTGTRRPPGIAATSSDTTDAILAAAESDRAALVGQILDLGFPIEAPVGEDGGTVLHAAAYAGAAAAVRLLLDRGADVTAPDRRWQSMPLEWACIGSGERPDDVAAPDWPAVVGMLLDAGAPTDEVSASPDQPKPPSAAVAGLLRSRGVS